MLYVHGFNDYFFQTHVAEELAAHGYTLYGARPAPLRALVAGGPDPALVHRPHRVLPGALGGGADPARRARPRPLGGHGALHRWPRREPVGAQPATRRRGRRARAQQPVVRPQRRLVPPGGRHQDPRRGTRRPPAGRGRRALGLLLAPARRPRRAVGLRPRPQAARAGSRCAPAGCERSGAGRRAWREGCTSRHPSWCAPRPRAAPNTADNPLLDAQDTILDVDQIAERAPRLGDEVTLVRIAGGVHDLALSAPRPRAIYLRTVLAWLSTLDVDAGTEAPVRLQQPTQPCRIVRRDLADARGQAGRQVVRGVDGPDPHHPPGLDPPLGRARGGPAGTPPTARHRPPLRSGPRPPTRRASARRGRRPRRRRGRPGPTTSSSGMSRRGSTDAPSVRIEPGWKLIRLIDDVRPPDRRPSRPARARPGPPPPPPSRTAQDA